MGEGDRGSGLTFLHFESYYLTGVLSLKENFSNNSIAVFTRIKFNGFVSCITNITNSNNIMVMKYE